MINNYIEKGIRLHRAIRNAGYSLSQVDGVWISSDDTAVQAIIDSYDALPEAKADARQRVVLEASRLVAEIYPFINPEKEEAIGLYNFTTDMYLTTVAQARQPLSGRLLDFRDIYDTAQAKISEVNALATWQQCDAYDATIGW